MLFVMVERITRFISKLQNTVEILLTNQTKRVPKENKSTLYFKFAKEALVCSSGLQPVKKRRSFFVFTGAFYE